MHPPIHPQWIDVTLVGGPNDGHTCMVHRSRKLLMVGDLPDEGDERHTLGHAYVPRGDGKHFDYVGRRSIHEINALIKSGQLDPPGDDCDPADFWKD